MPRQPLNEMQWRLGTVAKMSLGGDDFVEADDSAYVTVDDAEGAVCEINIEGQHAREVALLTVAAPDLLAALKAVRPYFEGEHAHDHPESVQMRAAIAKAEGR